MHDKLRRPFETFHRNIHILTLNVERKKTFSIRNIWFYMTSSYIKVWTPNFCHQELRTAALEREITWSKVTLNYWMMVERHPNLKEEIGGSIPGCEISSLLDKKTCQVINYLPCFDASLSASCLKREKEKKKRKMIVVIWLRNSI